jgi:hypothetical protein
MTGLSPFFNPTDVVFCGESPVLLGVGALMVTACPNLGAAAGVATAAAAGTKAGGRPCAGPLRGLSWAMIVGAESSKWQKMQGQGQTCSNGE